MTLPTVSLVQTSGIHSARMRSLGSDYCRVKMDSPSNKDGIKNSFETTKTIDILLNFLFDSVSPLLALSVSDRQSLKYFVLFFSEPGEGECVLCQSQNTVI